MSFIFCCFVYKLTTIYLICFLISGIIGYNFIYKKYKEEEICLDLEVMDTK